MLAPIIVGFAMATLGVALIFVGEVPFLRGKPIRAARARLIGLVLVSFLPLALSVRQLVNYQFGRDAVEGQALTWSMCGVCWFLVVVLLFRVAVPKKPARKASAGAVDPMGRDPFGQAAMDESESLETAEEIEDAEPLEEVKPAKKIASRPAPAEPTKKAPVKKPRPKAEESNPFDFS